MKNLLMSAPLSLAVLLTAAPLANAALIVHYDFEANTNDQSGTGNNGTLLNGAGFVADSPFGGGQSLALANGGGIENQGVNVPANASLASNPFTLAYWIRATTDQASAAGLDRLTSRAGDAFETAIGNAGAVGGTSSVTGITLSYYQGGWNVTNAPITVGEWTHIAWVNSAANMELYLDGISVYTGPAADPARPGAGFMNIGTRHNEVEGFEGNMDDFRLYDSALSASEVADLARIPEPSAAVLLLAGFAGVALRRRR